MPLTNSLTTHCGFAYSFAFELVEMKNMAIHGFYTVSTQIGASDRAIKQKCITEQNGLCAVRELLDGAKE